MDSLFSSLGYGNFILVLGILVFVHELGHYLVARWCGVRIDVFSIGFGKELFGWTDKRGTRWKLALIPLGGYVKMFGESDNANPGEGEDSAHHSGMSEEEKSVSFAYKKLWQRAAIVAAGPGINFLFAIVIFMALFMGIGKPTYPDFSTHGIGRVIEGSAAEEAGFKEGDVIVAVGQTPIQTFGDLRNLVLTNRDKVIEYSIYRDNQAMKLTAQAREAQIELPNGDFQTVYRLGILGPSPEMKALGVTESLIEASLYTWNITAMTFEEIGKLFIGQGDVDNLGGPIKIAQMSSDVGALGILALVNFVALLSINLGLLNLLPIPMLDGGHLLVYAIEAILGRPVPERIQEVSLKFGLAFLLTLMVFVMGNDIINL